MDTAILSDNLTKVFRKKLSTERVVALDGLNLEVKKGEVFGILGPNGSGKTTLIKLLLGLIHPTKGKALIVGKSPRNIYAKKEIGYLPEAPYFYDYLNPCELLYFYAGLFGLTKRKTSKRVDELLELVGLSEFRKMPLRDFSKGMLQRIGLASALINDPAILFLDEPTLGLDPIGKSEIQNLLGTLKKNGKTILLSSHLLGEVEESCDRIGILYKGRLIRIGRVKELLSKKDKVEFITDELSQDAILKIRKIIEEDGSRLLKMDKPRETLHKIFVDVIRELKGRG